MFHDAVVRQHHNPPSLFTTLRFIAEVGFKLPYSLSATLLSTPNRVDRSPTSYVDRYNMITRAEVYPLKYLISTSILTSMDVVDAKQAPITTMEIDEPVSVEDRKCHLPLSSLLLKGRL